MARFEPRTGLDELVATRFGRPAVQRVLGMLEHEAKLRAPTTRVWVTSHDERVRATHVEADGQIIPSNLRFKLHKEQVDTHGLSRSEEARTRPRRPNGEFAPSPHGRDSNRGFAPGWDLARFPGDPDLPIGQRIHCRCDDPTLPDKLRDSIHATGVHQEGCRVSGQVETRFPRAAESEHGTDKDEPAHFMAGALREVAAQLRAHQHR